MISNMIKLYDNAWSMNGYFMVWRYVYKAWMQFESYDPNLSNSASSFNNFAEYNFGIMFGSSQNNPMVEINEEFYTYIILRNSY